MGVLDHILPSWSAIAADRGCSLWRATFRDGRTVTEPQVPDWMHLAKPGLVKLELICPNGEIGTLPPEPVERDLGESFFQFKIGSLDTAIGPIGEALASRRRTVAHVIGLLDSSHNGDCTCFAFEYERSWSSNDPTRTGNPLVLHVLPPRLYGPFRDTYPNLSYGNNVLSLPRLDLLGVR